MRVAGEAPVHFRCNGCWVPAYGRDDVQGKWRPEPESNRRARICSPLRNHSAIGPEERDALWRASALAVNPRLPFIGRSMNDGWRGSRVPI